MPVADIEIIKHLNAVLKNKLTAINQYFLHARMLKHRGIVKLADYEYKASIDAMKHSDMLVEYILSLGGAPTLQELGKLMVGDSTDEMLKNDLKLSEMASGDVQSAIAFCESRKDAASVALLGKIADSQREHIQFLVPDQFQPQHKGMRMKNILMILITLTLGVTCMAPKKAKAADLENTLYMDLKDDCRVTIELRPDLAPNHVKRIKELTRQGFYNGVVFHRVIDGFMAQTGDPTGTGTGGSGKKIKAEFSRQPHVRGTLSMARAADINSADSQFFIVLADSTFLDGQYTVWGKVTKGMECVDKVKKGDKGDNGKVSSPDKIIKMEVAADEKK